MKEVSQKNRLVALLLCWFLGVLGFHRYYVGKHTTSIIMFLISITFIGLFVTGIWAFIDLIMIASGSFEDKDGKVLKNW